MRNTSLQDMNVLICDSIRRSMDMFYIEPITQSLKISICAKVDSILQQAISMFGGIQDEYIIDINNEKEIKHYEGEIRKLEIEYSKTSRYDPNSEQMSELTRINSEIRSHSIRLSMITDKFEDTTLEVQIKKKDTFDIWLLK